MATTLSIDIDGGAGTDTGVLPGLGVTQTLGAGTGTQDSVTQIAAGMVEQQLVNQNGNPVAWVSNYVAVPFTLAGQINFSINAREDVAGTNISLRAKVSKLPARIEAGFTHVGTFDYGSELATSTGDRTWSGTPATPVLFERNSRILLILFYRAFGTPAAGTGTFFDDGQNSMTLTEDVTFSTVPLISPIRSIPILGQPRPLF